jgi:hypothetical protein
MMDQRKSECDANGAAVCVDVRNSPGFAGFWQELAGSRHNRVRQI